ncbi:AIP3-domain-containing protein [Punctularia strigosozonata HHB-11173 SS5]|uniref:AIP3-domain-containing protein n=1 Tax=Punctularia strigosozonata (strain HHB-11173) TaxID=741275 RepID=UPI00044178EA|nr:AIP3-domain-containing protein [Punctularia strigosozonata HHB-11173 SS5]EIN09398.1 AIP3-domain-containing protein [Punctularia strigosozonata HHB-11173 SS5]
MSSPRTPGSPPSQPYQQGHVSRRDNQSVSSSYSASSSTARNDRGTRTRGNQPAVESAVTRLLVSIKSLLEYLTLWSNLEKSESEVSDVYVRLGNDFNAAVSAFGVYDIDMSELITVPDDLRTVLEECLSEEATPKNLDKYLPTVRQIITRLLQGLRNKQSLYRKNISEHRHRSSASSGHDRTDSRSSRATERSSRATERSSRGVDGPFPTRSRTATEEGTMRRSTASTRSRRKDSEGAPMPSREADDEPFVGGFVNPSPSGIPQHPPPRSDSYFSVRSDPPGDGTPHTRSMSSASNGAPSRTPTADSSQLPPPPPPIQQAPAHVKRYSLVDKPSTPPAVVVVESPSDEPPISISPPPETPSAEGPQQIPAMASSLAALKKSDTLERRASKRFSMYNISKMTGGSIRSPGQGNRRSMAAASNALTPGELAVLTEADEGEEVTPKKDTSQSRSRGHSPDAPPVPPLPKPPSVVDPSPAPEATAEPSLLPNGMSITGPPQTSVGPSTLTPPPSSSTSSHLTVFLQVGRDVKKVTMDHGCSFSSLRMLFVDKFAYSPGQGDFPAIYIRDPSSGVQYELEDMDEVKDRCLLSLNIEPLDQIKQHIDTQIASLAQDIKDLKSSVSNNRRMSSALPPIVGQAFDASTPGPTRPTDRQLAHVARRLSRIVDEESASSSAAPVSSQFTAALVPQMTGVSVLSENATRIVSDLRTQFDEVQNLRRDLGVMRQVYTDFIKQTKDSLGHLRAQTQNVRQLASAKVGGARAYIDSGKANLDQRSQTVLTKMEELQDLVESVKDDVLKKNVRPKPGLLKNIKEDMEAVATELSSLEEHIKTVKPMWKKTWEEELQNIVEEQQFLHHQEEFMGDLLEDHKAVTEVWGHVEKVLSVRGNSTSGRGGKARGYRPPPPPEEGGGGLTSVMMEIRSAAVDPERRMKAIAANQKNREKELSSRSDEFQEELTGFVQGKKLKMTGGAEETERLRQKRNDMALKAMFTGGGTPTLGSSAPPSPAKEDEVNPEEAS